MGQFAIRNWAKIASWISAAIIITLNVKLVLNEINGMFEQAGTNNWWVFTFIIPPIIAIALLLLYIIAHPFLPKRKYVRKGLHKEFLPIDFELKNPFRRIAVTLDFSVKDQQSISRALSMGGTSADYLLIHIVESAGALMMEKDISDLESNEDYEMLKRYSNALTERGFRVSYELGYGRRSVIIPEFVNKFNADLLVMGAHGHRGIKDFILGETINAVRHRIQIPLLAVK
jgi:manganese transport protein